MYYLSLLVGYNQSMAKEQNRAQVYKKSISQVRDKLSYRLLAEILCC